MLHDNKEIRFEFRCSQIEKEAYELAATKLGLSTSMFIRLACARMIETLTNEN